MDKGQLQLLRPIMIAASIMLGHGCSAQLDEERETSGHASDCREESICRSAKAKNWRCDDNITKLPKFGNRTVAQYMKERCQMTCGLCPELSDQESVNPDQESVNPEILKRGNDMRLALKKYATDLPDAVLASRLISLFNHYYDYTFLPCVNGATSNEIALQCLGDLQKEYRDIRDRRYGKELWSDITADGGCDSAGDDCLMRDNVTHLIWSEGGAAHNTDSADTMKNWDNARAHCQGLNEEDGGAGYGGITRWRLPTRTELQDAYYHGIRQLGYKPSGTEHRSGDALDNNSFFIANVDVGFWSATGYSWVTTYASWVNLLDGIETTDKKTASYRILCVYNR